LVAPPKKKKKVLAHAPVMTFEEFEHTLLSSWIRAHGVPQRMLPKGGRMRPAVRNPAEPDIRQYSFDRLMVVDRDETADMLLANNLHFETNMPVVSINGYPQDVFGGLMEMLRRNPNLKVFALHDATVTGCQLPLKLREDTRWFPQPNVQVINLGIRPRQVAALPDLPVRKGRPLEQLPPELSRNLTFGERRWLLGGNSAELDSFKPSQLMRAIYRLLQKSVEEEQRMRFAAANDPRGFFRTALPGVPMNMPAMASPNPAVPPDKPAGPWPSTPGTQNTPPGRS
jgi:hypothetical protein